MFVSRSIFSSSVRSVGMKSFQSKMAPLKFQSVGKVFSGGSLLLPSIAPSNAQTISLFSQKKALPLKNTVFSLFPSSKFVMKPLTVTLPAQFGVRSTSNAAATRDLYQKHFFHYSALGLAVLTPISIFLSQGSLLQFLSDVSLAIVLPIHGYWGMRLVIQDYVPHSFQLFSIILLMVTILTIFGLLRLTLEGDGIGGNIKRVFRAPKEDEDEEEEH